MNTYGSHYWFGAKRHGWGWALPVTWQGWLVFAIWFPSLVLGARFVRPYGLFAFLTFMCVMVGAYVFVCFKKGEPLGWRWG